MDSMKICLDLLAAESEDAVQAIIDSVPEMSDPNNWKALDGRDTNFNIVTNQASTGGKAATELMTNMVDAILMKRAYEEGIDPKDPDEAPSNMYEAVDRLVANLRGGKLVNADRPWLQDFASKNLIIGITGSRETTRKSGEWPCYTFVDNGEGQHPDKFESTFLSLSARNKSDIPFVQGKYNMGSSGVLAYCGKHWFKLIVSRRYDRTGSWGWTLIRKRPDRGTPVADYFGMHKEIPSFNTDALYPLHKSTKARFDGVMLKAGTVVKLYDFRVGGKFKSFRGAREAFNENLTESILPFRIMDFRYPADERRGGLRAQGIDARPFYGMEYILRVREDGDEAASTSEEGVESLPEPFQVGAVDDPELGHIEVSAIPLDTSLPGWLKPSSSNNRIFHSVNGQVLYKQTRGHLSRCGYSGIKDRVALVVNASQLSDDAHNTLWKGDRENIIQSATGERYLETVSGIIKTSPSLDQWKQQVAREDIKRIANEDTVDLFQKLVDSDRELVPLLDNRDPNLNLPSAEDDEKKYEGKYDPTEFSLVKEYDKTPLEIPLNKARAFIGITNAVNDFLIRADNRGELVISSENIRRHFTIKHILHNGRLTVFFSPESDDLQADDRYSFSLGLVSPSMPHPLTQPVSLKLLAEEEPKKKKKRRRKKRENQKDKPRRSLPPYALLTKDGREVFGKATTIWPEDFTEFDGGMIREAGDRIIYNINFDNTYHLRYRIRAKSDMARDLLSQKYITGMRLFMLGFENSLQKFARENDDESMRVDFEDSKDDYRAIAARGAASVVLWLTDQLPKVIDNQDDDVE
ncbi:MAG: hypothetical protein OXH59_13025 [Rhodospirillaceae bacterium]|nr:hypothetical protein [Rhodospirillaceae bacterium]